MVWKYPTKKDNSELDSTPERPVRNLTNDQFDKVMRRKTKSTYQVDYKGLPPGKTINYSCNKTLITLQLQGLWFNSYVITSHAGPILISLYCINAVPSHILLLLQAAVLAGFSCLHKF